MKTQSIKKLGKNLWKFSKIIFVIIVLLFLTIEVLNKGTFEEFLPGDKNDVHINLVKNMQKPSIKKELEKSFLIPIETISIKTKKVDQPIKTIPVVVKKPIQIKKEILNTLLPIRIKIPAIGVDAKLESVGLTNKGIVGIPKGFSNAAWLNTSTLPGDIGTSIIDGHFGYIRGIPAVFNNLDKLKKGDRIYVVYLEKEEIFIVRELLTYNRTDESSDLFGTNDGQSHLNIITCNGVWDNKIKNYSDRLIVFSDKEVQ